VLGAVLLMCTAAMSMYNAGNKIGVKVAMSQEAMTILKDELLPIAEAAALSADIPDMSEKTHVPVVGNVEMTMKDMKLNRLKVENSSVVFTTGNTVQVSFTGLSLDITLHWHYRESSWPHISDSGSGEGSTSHASGTVAFVVGSDATGHPTAKFSTCGMDLSGLSISLHGGASWLYDVVISLFHSKIVHALESGLCKVLNNDIQLQLNQMLEEIPIQYDIDEHIAIDYSLGFPNGAYVTDDGFLVATSQGEFFPKGGQPGNAPGEPVAMPDAPTKSQFQVMASEFTVESLGYTAVQTGLAEMVVTKDMAPAMAKDFFSTDFYGQYAPGILDRFGAGADVELFIALHETPDVIFTQANGIDVKAGVEMTVRAMNSSTKAFDNAFTLLLTCDVDGEAKVSDTTISGQLTDASATASLVQTQVGTVDIDGFNDLIQFVLMTAIDTANQLLAKGTPLPSIPGMEFVNPNILYRDGYLVVATDIHFTAPTKH